MDPPVHISLLAVDPGRPANPYGRSLRMRVIISHHLSDDDATWKRFDRGREVSGYHHNARGGFLMLRPGLYAAGEGETRFGDFRYTAL